MESIAFRWKHGLAALVLGMASLTPALAAVDEDDLLPVDQAFALSAKAASADRIALDWKIADGYYLYRHRIKATATGGARLGAIELPHGTPHEDEFFGRVETFRGHLAGTVPVIAAGGGSVTLKIGYQGCADAGICYPPQTRTLTVKLPARAAVGAPRGRDVSAGDAQSRPWGAPTKNADVAKADAGFAALGQSLGGANAVPAPGAPLADAAGKSKAPPLPEEQAFRFEAIADGGNALLLRYTPAPGYYLYRDKMRLSLDAGGPSTGAGQAIALGAPRWPRGKPYRDEHFGNVSVYFDQIDVPVPLRRTNADAQQVVLTAAFQGCQDNGICYPPMTRTVRVALPAGKVTPATETIPAANDAAPAAATPVGAPHGRDAPAGDAPSRPGGAPAGIGVAASAAPTHAPSVAGAEVDDGDLAEDVRLAAGLAGSSRWLALLGFFGAGLLLAFTPCVLPMIPILSGLIAGAGTRLGTRRALWLSFVYVLANALVFTAAGVVAALVGANLQAAFQVPWVIVLFAGLFVALALSSFGLYELQLPNALRSKLGGISDRQHGGSLAGVAAMGALSALIVGPCVAPPLAAAVLYISQSHDPVFGGAALFLLAMGMGLPLLAFGAAAGRGMPTSGPWMTAVQHAFGFVFLALAAWMLSRIVPGPVTLALFGLLALAAAAWAWGGTRSDSRRVRLFTRFAGLLLAVVGAAELFGALAGARNPLQPLAGFSGGHRQARELVFRTIKSSDDLDRELAAAQAAGKPLLFDFYADWCVSCKEMEAYTFTDPAVHDALADFVLLKADVTANDAVDQALMQRFGIIGPPATLFFSEGREQRALRLVGFEKSEPFVARTRRAGR